MKPLAVFINLAGPINHPEHGQCYQIEMGVKQKDGKEECVSLISAKPSVLEAIDVATKSMKGFIQKYYPKQAGNGKPPENLIKLEG